MKNFFKNYFKGFGDSDYPFWKVMIVVLPIAILITTGIESCSNNYKQNHSTKYDTYEILIIDKYEDIGSTWHLIGGRASETEYHIVYKVIPLTENAEKVLAESFYGSERDTEIQYKSYRKVQIGQKYTTNYPYINFN